jgi:hypothetical protein
LAISLAIVIGNCSLWSLKKSGFHA